MMLITLLLYTFFIIPSDILQVGETECELKPEQICINESKIICIYRLLKTPSVSASGKQGSPWLSAQSHQTQVPSFLIGWKVHLDLHIVLRRWIFFLYISLTWNIPYGQKYVAPLFLEELKSKFPKASSISCCIWEEPANVRLLIICYSIGKQNSLSLHAVQWRAFVKFHGPQKWYLYTNLSHSRILWTEWTLKICSSIS